MIDTGLVTSIFSVILPSRAPPAVSL